MPTPKTNKTNNPKPTTTKKATVKRRPAKQATAPAAPDLQAQIAALQAQIAAQAAQLQQAQVKQGAPVKRKSAWGAYSTIATTLHGYVQQAQGLNLADLAAVHDLKVTAPNGADLAVQIVTVQNNTAMPFAWQKAHGGVAQFWVAISTANMAILQADLGIKPASPTKATHLVGCSFNNTTSSPMAKALSPLAGKHGYKVAIAGLTQQGTFKAARGAQYTPFNWLCPSKGWCNKCLTLKYGHKQL